MRFALAMALGLIVVTVYRRLGRESWQPVKVREADKVSPEWLIENVYKEGKAS